MEVIKVLFVCMGNICRSPTAQGVFESLVNKQGLSQQIYIDSAGTHSYHIGEAPDKRSQKAALYRGVDLSSQKARRFEIEDLSNFDYVLAMDKGNLRDIRNQQTHAHTAKVSLFLPFAMYQDVHAEVPDPYYGGANGFENVLDLVESASEGLLQHIKQQHNL